MPPYRAAARPALARLPRSAAVCLPSIPPHRIAPAVAPLHPPLSPPLFPLLHPPPPRPSTPPWPCSALRPLLCWPPTCLALLLRLRARARARALPPFSAPSLRRLVASFFFALPTAARRPSYLPTIPAPSPPESLSARGRIHGGCAPLRSPSSSAVSTNSPGAPPPSGPRHRITSPRRPLPLGLSSPARAAQPVRHGEHHHPRPEPASPVQSAHPSTLAPACAAAPTVVSSPAR
ncbi:hypothetical protein CDD83_2358 [Cordyceps sp. RAO-2017]|nr:hypothetical protein CDD83_2358 [Cordyceps sp. RAO-2017]